MDSTTRDIFLASFGNLKLARYLVRSYGDLVDVCQTVARQVVHCAEREQVFSLFNSIECTCIAVPNTLSSVIMGLRVPESILQRQGFRSRPTRIPELRVPATQAPKYARLDGDTVFTADVACFFDLYLMHRFIREAMSLAGEGMKLIKSKRAARLAVSNSKQEGANFEISLAFPCKCKMESLIQLESRFLREALTGD